MILFKKAIDLRNWLDAQRKKAISIGFVPTMGALHAGHISLIDLSKKENGLTICSIFINPTQFNDPKDFKKYPVTIEKDIDMLEESGCDVLFLPTVEEMYPKGTNLSSAANCGSNYDLGRLETILEGKYRPGHFQGVCMIVHRLLDIIRPQQLYLGQKDYQQCLVIQKLAALTGMEKLKVKISPTLREEDGLAMSSRNLRLTKEERVIAVTISRILEMIKKEIRPGNITPLIEKANRQLTEAGFRVDYVSIADAYDLSGVTEWDGKQKIVALVAANLNEVRLIDNIVINS